MPTLFTQGDLFAAKGVRAFAQGCNCAGAMGKGIAVGFKLRYPKMFAEYRQKCREGTFLLGDVMVWSDGRDRVQPRDPGALEDSGGAAGVDEGRPHDGVASHGSASRPRRSASHRCWTWRARLGGRAPCAARGWCRLARRAGGVRDVRFGQNDPRTEARALDLSAPTARPSQRRSRRHVRGRTRLVRSCPRGEPR